MRKMSFERQNGAGRAEDLDVAFWCQSHCVCFSLLAKKDPPWRLITFPPGSLGLPFLVPAEVSNKPSFSRAPVLPRGQNKGGKLQRRPADAAGEGRVQGHQGRWRRPEGQDPRGKEEGNRAPGWATRAHQNHWRRPPGQHLGDKARAWANVVGGKFWMWVSV